MYDLGCLLGLDVLHKYIIPIQYTAQGLIGPKNPVEAVIENVGHSHLSRKDQLLTNRYKTSIQEHKHSINLCMRLQRRFKPGWVGRRLPARVQNTSHISGQF